MIQFSDSDWKLFRKKIPSWQEDYMDRLCAEYVAILTSDRTGADRFWDIEKRVRKDEKKTGVVADMRRSQLVYNLVNLVSEGVIGLDDLNDFSEELQEAVRMIGGFKQPGNRESRRK